MKYIFSFRSEELSHFIQVLKFVLIVLLIEFYHSFNIQGISSDVPSFIPDTSHLYLLCFSWLSKLKSYQNLFKEADLGFINLLYCFLVFNFIDSTPLSYIIWPLALDLICFVFYRRYLNYLFKTIVLFWLEYPILSISI